MIHSLGARLFVGALLFLSVALFLTWLALSRLFQSYVDQSYHHELLSVSDTIAAGISAEVDGLTLMRRPVDPRYNVPASGRYWQVEGLKDGMKRSRSLWDQELKNLKPLTSDPMLFFAQGPGGYVVAVNNEILFERGGKNYKATISVGADRAEYDAATSEFRNELMQMLALTGTFLALASALQIFVGLQPLVRVRKAVAAVRHGASSSINEQGPVEVRPLIAEINTLLSAERAAVERARARASDLAHGLKTPLTILAQISESMEKSGEAGQAVRIREQVAAIRSRTDRQLALARSGVRGASRLEIGPITAKLARVVSAVAQARGVHVENSIGEGKAIRADATDYVEAIGNLIDNAIAHAKGHVVVSAQNNGSYVRITVADDGAGIQAKDRDTALARGQKLDESGTGSGLGLAITADIVRAYGGSISLGTSDMSGLAVHLDWPEI